MRNYLTKQDITVSVFRTNIEAKDIITISSIFNKIPSIQKWNTDLEDIDNILRIESFEDIADMIINTLSHQGFQIEELKD